MPRGQTTRTPERVAEAQRMYAAGLTGMEVAAECGISRSTAYEWLNDPHRVLAAARRQRYGGRCIDCGAATNGSGGATKAAERCVSCRAEWQHEQATWTRERLIAEAHRWHGLTGAWPTATHWHTTCGSTPSAEFRAAVLEFRALTGPWPNQRTTTNLFGSWSAFMAATGGLARGTSRGVKRGQRAAEMRAVLAKLNGTRPNGDS